MAHDLAAQQAGMFPDLLKAAENYLAQLGVEGLKKSGPQTDGLELELEDVTAFIQISGELQGGFVFTVDHGMSRKLAKLFMVDEINELESGQYAVEVVAEVANIVTAHSISEKELELYLGNPLMILSRQMEITAPMHESQAYEAAGGRFRCMYIPMMEKAELAGIVRVRACSGIDREDRQGV